MKRSQYDVVVIGGGPGGYVAAARAARFGLSTALVESWLIGGTCINIGCMPTKALLETVHRAEQVRTAPSFGVRGVDPHAVEINWPAAIARVDRLVLSMRDGVQHMLERAGVELVRGTAKLLGKGVVEVTQPRRRSRTLRGSKLIIAAGAVPDPAPVQAAADRLLGLSDFYRLPRLPQHFVVFGSGQVATELALLVAMAGVNAALVAAEPTLLSALDSELGAFAERRLRRAGVALHLGRGIVGTRGTGVVLDDGSLVRADHLLHAGRRLPDRSAWAGLELAEHESGLKVDRFGRTSLPEVYAVGDVTGGMMTASAASALATVAVDHILGRASTVDLARVPTAVYLEPELASVGASEEQLQRRGIAYRASRYPLAANSKALIADEVDGFVKVLSDTEQGEVLGVHIAAANATDLISEAALAIRFGLTADEMAAVVHPHPAFSESVVEAARG